MPDCAFVTFGCKINQYDTQAIREEILDLGYQEVDKAEGVDLVVVNSCTVTERAGLKVEERVKSLTKKNPNADVIVTGCISEDDRERLVEIPGVVHLIGNEEKHRVAEIVAGADPSEGLTKRKSRDIFGLKILHTGKLNPSKSAPISLSPKEQNGMNEEEDKSSPLFMI